MKENRCHIVSMQKQRACNLSTAAAPTSLGTPFSPDTFPHFVVVRPSGKRQVGGGAQPVTAPSHPQPSPRRGADVLPALAPPPGVVDEPEGARAHWHTSDRAGGGGEGRNGGGASVSAARTVFAFTGVPREKSRVTRVRRVEFVFGRP